MSESIDALASRAGLRQQLEAHTESLDSDEAALALKKIARGELFEKMKELQQRVYNLRSEKENADNQAEFASIRANDLEGRISEYQNEIEGLEDQKEALAERAENEAENKQMQLDVVDDSDRIFQDRSTELVRAQEQLGEMEAQLQRRRQEVLHAENRISRARSNCTTLEVNLKTYQVKHASLSENVLQLNEEVEVLERDLNEIQRTLAKRRQEQEASDHAVQAAREESKAILNQFRCLQERIQEQDRGIARKTAQLNVLEGLQAKFEGFGEGAKAILGDKLGEVLPRDSVSIVSKELKVQPAYTKAIETLLGPAMEALFVGKSDKALSVAASSMKASWGGLFTDRY